MNTSWILPMAGVGSRLLHLSPQKHGIEICGRPIFAWCLTGIKDHLKSEDELIFVTRNFEQSSSSGLIADWLNKLEIACKFSQVEIDFVTKGPAHTTQIGLNYVTDEANSVMVVNPDQYCKFDTPSKNSSWDVFVPIILSKSSKASYVDLVLEEEDWIIETIREKHGSRLFQSSGVYGFSNLSLISEMLVEGMLLPPNYKNEFFIGPMINLLKKKLYKIIATTTTVKFSLGEQKELDNFSNFISELDLY